MGKKTGKPRGRPRKPRDPAEEAPVEALLYPMECVDCDYKYVTLSSLEAPACGLCGSTRRIRHHSLREFKEETFAFL